MNVVSFFTGAGGLDMGIQQAGFDIKLCVELEPKYCQTLILNHPEWNVKCEDIRQYNKQKVYEEAKLKADDKIHLVIGGCPCQSFSTAGKRLAFEDPRGQAMLKYAELIEELQPKVFLLENVRGLLSARLKHRKIKQGGQGNRPLSKEEMPGSAFKYLLDRFKSYDVQHKLINAANYGVPQKRERVFIVGTRKDLKLNFDYPEATHNKNGGRGKKKWLNVSGVFEKLNSQKHKYVTYSAERLKYMKMIPKGGGNWRDFPPDVAKEAMGGGL